MQFYNSKNNKNTAMKKEILYQFSVDLPNRHNKGGQSQNRMLRLNDEAKHNYIRKCCENASKHFISNNKVWFFLFFCFFQFFLYFAKKFLRKFQSFSICFVCIFVIIFNVFR